MYANQVESLQVHAASDSFIRQPCTVSLKNEHEHNRKFSTLRDMLDSRNTEDAQYLFDSLVSGTDRHVFSFQNF